MDKNQPVPELVPLAKWDQFFLDPSIGALRWMVFSNKEFERRCVLRRGRRILIDTVAYKQWLRKANPDCQ